MNEPANFLPELNGELRDFEIVYRDLTFHTARHTVKSKSAINALKSFAKAVPWHGKIYKVRKVVPV